MNGYLLQEDKRLVNTKRECEEDTSHRSPLMRVEGGKGKGYSAMACKSWSGVWLGLKMDPG